MRTPPEGKKLVPVIGGDAKKRVGLGRGKSILEPSASLIADDYFEAAVNYDPVLYSSKEIKAKAKIYFLNQGWRLELKSRASNERQDLVYVSPKGNTYYSLHKACLALQKEQKYGRMIDDGRWLAQCQMQAPLRKIMRAQSGGKRTGASSNANKRRAPLNKERTTDPSLEHDIFCFVCRTDGEVVLCDRCTRSFHTECFYPELQKIPATEDWSKWFCPNCRCDKCGGGVFSDDKNFTESTVLFCDQCECLFHVGCLDDIGMPKLASCPQGKWFCSQKCSEVFLQLRDLVGKVNLVGDGGLSWTLLRSTEEDRDPSRDEDIKAKTKLSVALSVMQECFSRIEEYRTGKDYVEEIIFNRGCERNLLKFQGFYTAVLEKNNKLISVATMRVHGKRVAEMPLIATRSQYRHKGMCHLLLNELQKCLNFLQVEKIVLPAIHELEGIWKNSFGFREMTSEEKFALLKLDIVHFPDTIMLQKTLVGASREEEILTETLKNKIKKTECHLGYVLIS